MKPYWKRNRSAFIGALFCILASTVFAVTLQFFKGDVLDHAAAGHVPATVWYTLLLICFILLEVGFYFGYRRLSARFSVGCAKDLKEDIWQATLRRSYIAYRSLPHGEYLAKYTNETDAVKTRYFDLLPMLWEVLFKVLLVSAALFLLDWRIALVTLLLLTTPLYLPKLIEKRLQRAQAEALRSAAEALARVNDWLSGFEVIKNFSIEQQIMRRFRAANDAAAEKLLREAQLGAMAQLITTLISYLSFFIILACSTALVLAGDFSAGDFFVAIGMVDQLSYPLISLSGIIRQLVAVRPTCAGLCTFVHAQGTEERSSMPMQREIRFNHVGFAYQPGKLVLSDFNLVIEKGKRYLLKGPSGCGKTTAANLLLRYYDAGSGSITVDGVPIGQCGNTYGWITVVRQEATLFRDTLRNNLTLYREMEDSALVDMLRKVGLASLANRAALDAMVEDHGANFSGGEKKRICLARALLRNTEMLILDEPLANLDDETAGRIEALLLSIPDRTLLVVSHQFSEKNLARFDAVMELAG